MENFSSRLKHAMDTRGISASELARRVGVTRGAVSFWIKGDVQSVTGSRLIALANALQVEPVWLTTGRGSMDTAEQVLTAEELEFIQELRQLSRQKQKIVLDTSLSLINNLK